jgi:hypothetical protein
MSLYREQALIEAPVTTVWELIGDVDRHPEWWPKVVEVECEGLDEGCNYRMVTKSPMGGSSEMAIEVERLEGCRELLIRCINTGTYCRWLLTEARGGTFVDAEFGMDPRTMGTRVFDALAGKRYFRRWVGQSLDGLRTAACGSERPAQAA